MVKILTGVEEAELLVVVVNVVISESNKNEVEAALASVLRSKSASNVDR